MTKSLLAGATAIALIAGAAMAQQAYDSTVSRTVTQPAPVDTTTSTRVQRSVDPYTGTTTERVDTSKSTAVPMTSYSGSSSYDPGRVTTYHEERHIAPGPQTVEKSWSTETTAPAPATVPTQQTTTWSRTTSTTER
jgi:hypothetical protein